MSRDEIRKLIGGYATDTLTPAERQALFEAALEDQELFDELAAEQALKEVLEQPGAKRRLIGALTPAPKPLWSRTWPWATAAATLAVAVLVVVQVRRAAVEQLAQVQVAERPQAIPPLRESPEKKSTPSAESRTGQVAQKGERQAALPTTPKPAPAIAPPAFQTNQPAPRATAPVPSPPPAPPPNPANSISVTAQAPLLQTDQAQAKKKDEAQQQAGADAIQEVAQPLLKTESGTAAPQAPAAAPQASPAARGAGGGRGGRGGGGGGGGGGARAAFGGVVANGIVAGNVLTAFRFDYSVTPEGRVRVMPQADGFLTVIVSGGTTLFSNRAVRAGSENLIDVPADAASATVIFTAQAATEAFAPAPGQIDPAQGSKSDPNPTPQSRLIAVIPLPGRQ